MKNHIISPSSLSFLWNECPRCFWRKSRDLQEAKDNNALFTLGNAFDKAAKLSITPEVAREIGCPVLDYTDSKAEWVTSTPIEFEEYGVSISFNGKTDRRYRTEDRIAIVDFKAGFLKDPERYSLAMHSYLWSIENPTRAKPEQVDTLGLICMQIGTERAFHLKGACCSIIGRLQYFPIEIDRAKFLTSLEPIAEVLAMERPPEAGYWCKFCATVEAAKALDERAA